MTLKGFSPYEAQTATADHIQIGHQIQNFLRDCGEDCDVFLEYDDVTGPFSFVFSGTLLSLEFDNSAINVVEYDTDTDNEVFLQSFDVGEVNKATHWLLTQVNQANQSS